MKLLIQLIGGLALFLYGMKICADGLKTSTGNWLNKLLTKMTAKKHRGVLLGIFTTLLTQSSSATSVILVSLVNSSILTLTQSLPVLLGAGIGTTLTVQLIAFRFFDYALLLVTTGVLTIFSAKKQALKTAGNILLGFGLIFYGMQVMSAALAPLKHSQELANILAYFTNNPWAALLASTLLTAIVQSSGATIAILITFAAQGTLGPASSPKFLIVTIPMIFGANLGTCITAFLGSIGTIRNAKRVAIAQITMKLSGVIIFMLFIPQLAKLTRLISSSDAARQLANAHTIFNIALTLLMLPFTILWSKLMGKILPVIPEEKPFRAIYLDESFLKTPDIALSQAKREIIRLAKILEEQIDSIVLLFKKKEAALFQKISDTDDKLDVLQKSVSRYLNQIMTNQLNQKLRMEAENLFYINSDLESTGDIIVKNIIPLAQKFQRKKVLFSQRGWKEIKSMRKTISDHYRNFIEALQHNQTPAMNTILTMIKRTLKKFDSLKRSHLKRLIEGHKETLDTSTVHMDLLDNLKKIEESIADMCRYFIR